MFDDRMDDSTAFDDSASTGEFFASSYMVEYSNRTITRQALTSFNSVQPHQALQ